MTRRGFIGLVAAPLVAQPTQQTSPFADWIHNFNLWLRERNETGKGRVSVKEYDLWDRVVHGWDPFRHHINRFYSLE